MRQLPAGNRSLSRRLDDSEVVCLPDPIAVAEVRCLVFVWLNPVAFNRHGVSELPDVLLQIVDMSHVFVGCAPHGKQSLSVLDVTN